MIFAQILNEERTVSCSNMSLVGDYTFAIIYIYIYSKSLRPMRPPLMWPPSIVIYWGPNALNILMLGHVLNIVVDGIQSQ